MLKCHLLKRYPAQCLAHHPLLTSCTTPPLNQLTQLNQSLRHPCSGEALPVGFPTLISQLQSKLKQAEVWVERVRSAVPRQNRTRNKSDMEKVEFGTMKNLLNEVRRRDLVCCYAYGYGAINARFEPGCARLSP